MFTSLILFILLAIFIIIAIEFRERKRAKDARNGKVAPSPATNRPEGCCGEHLVCERETLLNSSPEIVYFDDEELDVLAGVEPKQYSDKQASALRDVFQSLRAEDVAGWCRSLQLRNIALPEDIREEALLIVREQRQKQ